MRCQTHPDRVTPLFCEICEQAYCEVCLHKTRLGRACDTCAAAGRNLQSSGRSASRAPSRRGLALVGAAAYWLAVLTPLLLSGAYASDLKTLRGWVDFISAEPLRLGDVSRGLITLGATAERGQIEHQDAWEGHEWRAEVAKSTDPYSPLGESYRVAPGENGLFLCSVGPDRAFDGGDPIDRLSGHGDLCLRLRSPAILKAR